MSLPEEDRSGDEGVYQSAMPDRQQQRRKQRAKQAVVGVAGLAVLGAGAYFVTTQVTDRNATTETRDAGAMAPLASPATGTPPSASPEPTAEADTVAPTKGAIKQTTSPAPSSADASAMEEKVKQEIKEAREKAAKDGYSVKRPVTADNKLPSGPVNARDVPSEHGNLRVVSARYDLSGQRELLWAGDKGEKVGDMTCTQKFKFSNNLKASHKDNMLMCWRTTATKSVVTVIVDRTGKPSKAESAEAIKQEWAKLG
ncbi:hypothetical protein ACFY36_18770 [Actinoplanes sp. NPDC000266]